ncbi:hypothetical protein ACFSSC_10190 [Corynebacterium mendelii]|uniref:Cell surface protein n=1 Tax=Corynebacterium mendelii TaxID=2765362 RepID=A0A939E2S9_9CORY|nr:hypothetical protein [Corynebacterium mendelii]MBN9644387.1 hypothetical protein [Corynebacterium mendelii]
MKLFLRIPAAAALFIGTLLCAGVPSQALPPGGAGPDTPGTSATISPTTVTQCERISYKVTGFPAGETVNVKIDDGAGYSDQSVHGSGVVSRQQIASDGTASGSVVIDCDTTPGSHWLRFLAAAEIIDDKTGEYKGVDGYTRRGANFTVVAKSAGGTGTTGTGGAGSRAPVGTVNVDELSLDSKADEEFLKNRADQASGSQQSIADAAPAAGTTRQNTTAASGNRQQAAAPREAVTVTSVVEENITQGGGGADTSAGTEPTAAHSSLSADIPDSATTGDDSSAAAKTTAATGTPGTGGTRGEEVSRDAAAADAAAAPGGRAPVIGLLVGGAILVVGFAFIASYLYVNRRKN